MKYKKQNKGHLLWSGTYDFDELGIPPNSFDHGSLLHEELPEALDPVILEVPFKHLVVGQFYLASSLLSVFN